MAWVEVYGGQRPGLAFELTTASYISIKSHCVLYFNPCLVLVRRFSIFFLSRYSYFEEGCRKNVHATIPKGNMEYEQYQPPPHALRFSHGRGERETRVTGDELQGTMGRVLLPAFLCAHVLKRDVRVRGSDQYTVSDDCTCRTYFCCFPLALANTFPRPFVPILSNFFREQ